MQLSIFGAKIVVVLSYEWSFQWVEDILPWGNPVTSLFKHMYVYITFIWRVVPSLSTSFARLKQLGGPLPRFWVTATCSALLQVSTVTKWGCSAVLQWSLVSLARGPQPMSMQNSVAGAGQGCIVLPGFYEWKSMSRRVVRLCYNGIPCCKIPCWLNSRSTGILHI